MALRIPKNQIKESKYTSGGEYIIESTNAPYQGYYCEVNNVLYAGKTFDSKSPILIPIKNRNTLFNKGTFLKRESNCFGTALPTTFDAFIKAILVAAFIPPLILNA
jgi:hypothetical protein